MQISTLQPAKDISLKGFIRSDRPTLILQKLLVCINIT